MYHTRRFQRRRTHHLPLRLLLLAAALLLVRSCLQTDLLSTISQEIIQLLESPKTAAFLLGGPDALSAEPESAVPALPTELLPSPTPEPTPKPERSTADQLLYYAPERTAPTPPPSPEPTPLPETDSYSLDAESIRINNSSVYAIDPAAILAQGLAFPESPKVLSLHTHSCEAYTPTEEDSYTPSEPYRTEDSNYSVIRVGDALEAALTARGISVIHDTTLHDSPSYSGSYTRAMETIEAHLAADPSIAVVIDLHRDALIDAEGNTYSTSCLVNGRQAAQILLVSGTDSSGLDHPNWQQNLAFAFHLQAGMEAKYPGLTRPVDISEYRYNQHATTGSIILEVGCSGNTLQEALYAAELFADVCADVLTGNVVYSS